VIADVLARIAGKDERLVAGYMSGTSTDGIDVALTRIRGSGPDTRVELLGYSSVPFEAELRRRLLGLLMPAAVTAGEVTRLSYELAERYAQSLADLTRDLGFALSDIDLIGHHGVVFYHAEGMYADIGEASVIAERTGITVVTDFRVRDCAAGGQGAPLSPYVDWILFNHPDKSRAVQNIGGIANVCAMPANATVDDLIGFDTGPGNRIVDTLMALITGGQQTFDRDGAMAASGQVNEALLDELMDHPYIARELPKSAGRGEFGPTFTEDLLRRARTSGMCTIRSSCTTCASCWRPFPSGPTRTSASPAIPVRPYPGRSSPTKPWPAILPTCRR
jgi:anhydro-N-acetylmuramic acid kinase